MSAENEKRTILLCCGTGCIAGGSDAVGEALALALRESGAGADIKAGVKRTGCNGFCENGPIITILPDDISYYNVRPEDCREIVEKTLIGNSTVDRLLFMGDDKKRVRSRGENPFYAPQLKLALRNVGLVDPLSIDDYIKRGGYGALKKALAMAPDEIIREVTASGLRGRGGAGFPTGDKWRAAAASAAFPKYVICNGDEGDPGAFMDRSILEGDPHSVLEGLAIAALAIGAEEGFLYIRDEYGLARENVRQAIIAAEQNGWLGENILKSGKNLRFSIVRGGGAFVCGESSALMSSIEGRIGEPRAKYIRSAERGLWDKPTVLNNVETLVNVPLIISAGGAEFAGTGTEGSKGSKVFALVGKVKRTGLVEVPMGVSLRRLIFDIGGGLKGGRKFKAVQIGGPSGGCLPEGLLDLVVDFDTLTEYGAMMGSGGLVVMDEFDCMVETARYYTQFLADESCGKCTPCREGLRHMKDLLEDICEGRGQEGDIELLLRIGATMAESSRCALGKSAPNPILTTIKYFREEYGAHIFEKRCPAGVCAALTVFAIKEIACSGCGLCQKACPAGAVKGEGRKPRRVDKAACIACGSCRRVCNFAAVNAERRPG